MHDIGTIKRILSKQGITEFELVRSVKKSDLHDKNDIASIFNDVDKDCKDGISEDEWTDFQNKIDQNKDGFISENEIKEAGYDKTIFNKFMQTLDAAAEAKLLADKLYYQIHGVSLYNKTEKLLQKINPENIITVLNDYSDRKGSTLPQDIINEIGLDINTVKQYVCKPLTIKAKELGVSGIYFGDYFKIQDINKLNKWIENATNKVASATDKTSRKPYFEFKNKKIPLTINLENYKLENLKRKYPVVKQDYGSFECFDKDCNSVYVSDDRIIISEANNDGFVKIFYDNGVLRCIDNYEIKGFKDIYKKDKTRTLNDYSKRYMSASSMNFENLGDGRIQQKENKTIYKYNDKNIYNKTYSSIAQSLYNDIYAKTPYGVPTTGSNIEKHIKEISKENVLEILDKYLKINKDRENLCEAIQSERGLDENQKQKYLGHIQKCIKDRCGFDIFYTQDNSKIKNQYYESDNYSIKWNLTKVTIENKDTGETTECDFINRIKNIPLNYQYKTLNFLQKLPAEVLVVAARLADFSEQLDGTQESYDVKGQYNNVLNKLKLRYNDFSTETLCHELGHALDDFYTFSRYSLKDNNKNPASHSIEFIATYLTELSKIPKEAISQLGYASSSVDEMFAECYALTRTGDCQSKETILKYFPKTFELAKEYAKSIFAKLNRTSFSDTEKRLYQNNQQK